MKNPVLPATDAIKSVPAVGIVDTLLTEDPPASYPSPESVHGKNMDRYFTILEATLTGFIEKHSPMQKEILCECLLTFAAKCLDPMRCYDGTGELTERGKKVFSKFLETAKEQFELEAC